MKQTQIEGHEYVSFIPEKVVHEIHPGLNSLRFTDMDGNQINVMIFPRLESDLLRQIIESRS